MVISCGYVCAYGLPRYMDICRRNDDVLTRLCLDCSYTLLKHPACMYRQVDKQNMTRNWVIGLGISVAKAVLLRYMGCMKCAGTPKTLRVCVTRSVFTQFEGGATCMEL